MITRIEPMSEYTDEEMKSMLRAGGRQVSTPAPSNLGGPSLRQELARRIREARRGKRACLKTSRHTFLDGSYSGEIAALYDLAQSPIAKKQVPQIQPSSPTRGGKL